MSAGHRPRVLEIGSFAAAYCGRLWQRAGADVVQVQPSHNKRGWVSQAASAAFTDMGKRRVDLKKDNMTKGASLASLAARADIVIAEAATADELLALGFDDWSTPIKVSITPFGLTGPKRNWRATPNVILAMGGYTNMIGAPGRVPLNLPGHYIEFQTGALGYSASQAAHFAQSSDRIDLGMLEVLTSLHHYTTVRYHADGQVRQRRGSDLWFVVPSDLFACKDGWVYLTITPNFWEMFTLMLDRPELTLDERFANNDLRMQNRVELQNIIAESFASYTSQELEHKAQEFRVPLGIAQSPAEVLADTHLAERNFWEISKTEGHDQLQSPGLPWRGLQSSVPTTQAQPVFASDLW